ncbi:hypothetical protein FFI16_014555 [Pseudomonas sp. KBS0710]|uniref:hypothetical protein n=1 Tax=Pseudomonas sp. KBS0710 TaxID=1179667 RepID=UPI00110E724F|nr:hypothetical protein [Pseudomonas sp. KBS0710]TSD77594.1 hypothetical protein FFI16_014555 [Pseudomonas sp. KBS0710]
MKTSISCKIVLVICLTGWLATPAYAAFGDAIPGSALPPGSYPSSPADSNKKAETPPKEKASSSGSSTKQQGAKKPQKKAPKKDR